VKFLTTGEESIKTIHLEVISCSPLVSSLEAQTFKIWATDKKEHTNYQTFVPPALPMTKKPNKVKYWQLFCSIAPVSQAMPLT
jgi:hypothetical protein